eukprot:Skav208216  [mRNA]  locus=scaffold3686:21970:30201:- [translate_table: standard]
MPGPWIHLEDNPDFYTTFVLEKGSYLEVNLYDDAHADQGRALVRVLSSEERKKEGMWIQGKLISATDSHLRWWLTSGPGTGTGRKFLFHLCTSKVASCRKTKRKPTVEFHTDYFRTVTAGELTGMAVPWFKSAECKPEIEAEVARLAGNPSAGGAGSGTPAKKAKKKGEIDWAMTDEDPLDVAGGHDETGIKKKLEDLKERVSAEKANDPPEGETRKKQKKKDKAKKKNKKTLKERRKRGGKRHRDALESDDSSLTDNRPMWFGHKKAASSSSSSDSSDDKDEEDDAPQPAGSKDRPKDKKSKKKKSKQKKQKQTDRGPYGAGARVAYDGRKDEEISSEEDLTDQSGFRAASSHQSKQLQLQEYADKYPGRLSSRLLKRMEEILARGEGAMNLSGNNQTPATATAYLITIVEPRYKDRLNLRTSRELRSLTKALDCLALGRNEKAADIIAQRIKSIELYLADQVWSRAQFLELKPPEGATLAEHSEVLMTTKEQWAEHKMKIALNTGTWGGKGKGAHEGRYEEKGKPKGRGKGKKGQTGQGATHEKVSTPKESEGALAEAKKRKTRRPVSPLAKQKLKNPRARVLPPDEEEITADDLEHLSDDLDGCPPNLRSLNVAIAKNLAEWGVLVREVFKMRPTFTDLGRHLCKLAEAMPTSFGNFVRSYCLAAQPLTPEGKRTSEHGDLLPIPTWEINTDVPGVTDLNISWVKVICWSINFQYCTGWSKPICVPFKPGLSGAQVKAIEMIAETVGHNVLGIEQLATYGEADALLSSKRYDYCGRPVEYLEELVCEKVIPAWPKVGQAGVQPIEAFLTDETKKAMKDPKSLLLPAEKMPQKALRSKVRATDSEWFKIVQAASLRGMMRPVDDSEVTRDREGHLITNGAGAVKKLKIVDGKPVSCQRFISVMCPINAVTQALEGSQDTLPYIGQLSGLMLEEDESLYLESEDLQSAFNLFRAPEEFLGFFAYGKKVDSSAFGLAPGTQMRPALSVIPMGWHSAVALVQEAEKDKKKSEEKKVEEWKTPEERRNAFREAGDNDDDRRFSALTAAGERKQAFAEYISQAKKREKEEEREKRKRAKDDFIEALQKWKDLKLTTRYRDTAEHFYNEEWFKLLEEDERDLDIPYHN